jgi:hypothetical protein
MRKVFETDEDRMIYQLELHRDMITWVCNKLEEAGIEYERTSGNSSKGDVLLIHEKDIQHVKNMIFKWHNQFSSGE